MQTISRNISYQKEEVRGTIKGIAYQIPVELNSLQDVDVPEPKRGESLVFDGEKWIADTQTAEGVGVLSDLKTDAKSDLVSAVNELYDKSAEVDDTTIKKNIGDQLYVNVDNDTIYYDNETQKLKAKAGSEAPEVDDTTIKVVDDKLSVNIDNDTLYVDETDNKLKARQSGGGVEVDNTTIKFVNEKLVAQIDDDFDKNSELPVQNKIITGAINTLNTAIVKKSEEVTLTTSNWVGSSAPYTYDLSAYTESNKYDLEILPKNTWDSALQSMVVKAQIGSSGNDNKLYAWGNKPTDNIPVIIRKEYRKYGN